MKSTAGSRIDFGPGAPELRRDPLGERWVLIAPGRSERPGAFLSSTPAPPASHRKACPFCPGQEHRTPPEVSAVREPGQHPDSSGWRVRIVPNKYPALSLEENLDSRRGEAGLFEFRPGIGAHEVVIDSPDHDREFADLPVGSVEESLRAMIARIRTLETGVRAGRYIQLFKNKGRQAGASISHPHTQIAVLPVVPKGIEDEMRRMRRFFRKTGSCLLGRTLEEEIAAGARMISVDRRFAVTAPFASRFPYEIRIQPRRHQALISGLKKDEILALASVLKNVLSRVKTVLGDPSYNLVLHQAPHRAVHPSAHWYLEIIPILTRVAGFEWGTQCYINPVPPESAAAALRHSPIGHKRLA